ncbi:unnamed protein product [Prunus armeniaca]|uniref:Uncharacterized protein n=1 Tax=Prunus armeniaca TaxID=36596 RepID=A0A6J5UYP8_PRUAR|nr:unnamed protein product [Prunus armeniaca]
MTEFTLNESSDCLSEYGEIGIHCYISSQRALCISHLIHYISNQHAPPTPRHVSHNAAEAREGRVLLLHPSPLYTDNILTMGPIQSDHGAHSPEGVLIATRVPTCASQDIRTIGRLFQKRRPAVASFTRHNRHSDGAFTPR